MAFGNAPKSALQRERALGQRRRFGGTQKRAVWRIWAHQKTPLFRMKKLTKNFKKQLAKRYFLHYKKGKYYLINLSLKKKREKNGSFSIQSYQNLKFHEFFIIFQGVKTRLLIWAV